MTTLLENSSKEQVNPAVQDIQSANFFRGDQLESPKFKEPLISFSPGPTNSPMAISSLSGKFNNMNFFTTKLVSKENRIPNDTKMKVVYSEDTKLYYKYIMKGSRVWYLKRDEKVFYPCIVELFGVNNRKPTLKCEFDELSTVPQVEWADIFPRESIELIRDLGEFMNEKQDTIFEQEKQYVHTFEKLTPLLAYGQSDANKLTIIDSEDGKFHKFSMNLLLELPENNPRRIPNDTKMTADKKFKIILPKSRVFYHWKEEDVLIEGYVKWFSHKRPNPTIECINGKEFHEVDWGDIYPIESYEIIKDLAPIWRPGTSKTLPHKRARELISNNSDIQTETDQYLDTNIIIDNAAVNKNSDLSINNEPFCVGQQLSYCGVACPPYIFLSRTTDAKKIIIVDSATGKVRRLGPHLMKSLAVPMIPVETKMSADGKLKNILPQSKVLFRHSDHIYYPCVVSTLEFHCTLKLACAKLGSVNPGWSDIFPIESISLIPKPLKIYGFKEGEEVTVDMLKDFIRENYIESIWGRKIGNSIVYVL